VNRNKKIVAALAIIAVVLFALRYWPQHPKNPPETNSADGRASEPSQQIDKPADISPTNPSVPLAAIKSPPTNGQWLGYLKQEVATMNPIFNFRGKVIDQDGRPIEGANVRGTVREWGIRDVSDVYGRSIPFDLNTRSDGTFELLDASGDILEVTRVFKEGYQLFPRAQMGFDFVRNRVSNPNPPVIYRMWKKGAPETLVKFNRDTRIPYDGNPIVFDLLEGKK
jgi:hypothetical protein